MTRRSAKAGAARGTRWMVMAVGAALVAGGTFASLALFELNLELPEAAILLPIALTLGGVALLWAFAAVEWRSPADTVGTGGHAARRSMP